MPLVKLAAEKHCTAIVSLLQPKARKLPTHIQSCGQFKYRHPHHLMTRNCLETQIMSNKEINGRRPYYDTGPIPYESLSKGEQQTIVEVCALLMEIKQSAEVRSGAARDRDNSTDSIWGTAVPKLNNVILFDGERGVGKTSLMLTLINALSDSKEWKKKESNDNFPGDIDQSVRVMRQIDFDPLPPDLPIYSWIIQAFHPMVTKIINSNPDMSVNIFENDSFGEKNDSFAALYRSLHQAATVGWTTGLFKEQLGKDAAEFLMWQQEQQIDWQRLQKQWHNFIDKLLKKLENSDRCDSLAIPPNSLIVLPIDDLDLQVTRTRELLLALRVLRHNRLVYLLTGHANNTDLALTTSFYRDFIDRTSDWDEEVLDRIWESSKRLGQPLRDKTIPSSQIFVIESVAIRDALGWIPPVHKKNQSENTETFKAILNNLPICKGKQIKLGDFLASRPFDKRLNPKLTFRNLQGFSDKWSGQTNSSFEAVEEFLKLVLEDPLEEELIVATEQRVNLHFDRVIKLTGELSQLAAVSASVEKIDEDNITVKWLTQLDFYQKVIRSREPVSSDGNEPNPASPNFLLAVDLASEYSHQVEIDRNIKFIGCPLGFVWSEFHINEKPYLATWPMLRQPNTPSQLFKNHQIWMTTFELYQTREKGISSELLKSTWCKFNKIDDKKTTDEFSIFLDFLIHGDDQDSPEIMLELIDSYFELNSETKLLQGFIKPRVYELPESDDDLDYCDLVFRLRPLESK